MAMEMPNKAIYEFMEGRTPLKDPESAYIAITHLGETWHLFNAEKIPLGRMAEKIAIFIRGKHKPGYQYNRFDMGDRCVVVNAANVKTTGLKRKQKLYRHYTGYVGGLKEITMEKLLDKNPTEVIRRAVVGMLANNNIRDRIIDRFLIVHEGMYHNHIS